MTKGRWFFLTALIVTAYLVLAGCASAPDGAGQGQGDGETVNMADYEKEGFEVIMEDGRLWVFIADSEDLKKFKESGEPAKQVVRPVAGPKGITLKSTETETIDEYITAVPGFYNKVEDGRLWVFKAGSPELEAFMKTGEPAKQVVRPAAGPNGMTIKSVDTSIIDEYMAAWEMTR